MKKKRSDLQIKILLAFESYSISYNSSIAESYDHQWLPLAYVKRTNILSSCRFDESPKTTNIKI